MSQNEKQKILRMGDYRIIMEDKPKKDAWKEKMDEMTKFIQKIQNLPADASPEEQKKLSAEVMTDFMEIILGEGIKEHAKEHGITTDEEKSRMYQQQLWVALDQAVKLYEELDFKSIKICLIQAQIALDKILAVK